MYTCNTYCRNMWEVESLKFMFHSHVYALGEYEISKSSRVIFAKHARVWYVVFMLSIPGIFITLYIHLGCCTRSISQQRHLCIANEYQS